MKQTQESRKSLIKAVHSTNTTSERSLPCHLLATTDPGSDSARALYKTLTKRQSP